MGGRLAVGPTTERQRSPDHVLLVWRIKPEHVALPGWERDRGHERAPVRHDTQSKGHRRYCHVDQMRAQLLRHCALQTARISRRQPKLKIARWGSLEVLR